MVAETWFTVFMTTTENTKWTAGDRVENIFSGIRYTVEGCSADRTHVRDAEGFIHYGNPDDYRKVAR